MHQHPLLFQTILHELVVQQLRALRQKLRGSSPLNPLISAVAAWQNFAKKMVIDASLVAQISQELHSSYEWQREIYSLTSGCSIADRLCFESRVDLREAVPMPQASRTFHWVGAESRLWPPDSPGMPSLKGSYA